MPAKIEVSTDEMQALLKNKMTRCPMFGDTFRSLYACYKHSHGEFHCTEARGSLIECIGCTRWLREAEGYAIEDDGEAKDKGKEHWKRIEL